MTHDVNAKIESLIEARKRSHLFLNRNSKVYGKFLDLEAATYCDGSLDKKQKLLIGTAISVMKNCESCMEWHVGEAVRSGASGEEILEAIEVAYKMGGGPAVVSSRFAFSCLEYYT
jgi:AhpD family alkylhydroperoxidase